MIGSEGLLIGLRAIVATPMMLALYINEVTDPDPDQRAFKIAQDTPARFTTGNDWQLDAEQMLAVMPQHVFRFKGPSKAVYHGWVLLTREERGVVAWDSFGKPYPINREADSISAGPRIKLRRL